MKTATLALLAALLDGQQSSAAVLRGHTGGIVTADDKDGLVVDTYTAQCHKKVRRRVLGTRGNVATQDEFVVKDGFWYVGCEKDTMFNGPPKGINVSVVHYEEVTPKEDRKPVTPEMCFSFCRSKPEMRFFGLIHGRDCYCTPYIDPEANDDSACDAVCEGDSSKTCGSMTKTSVFEMHVCGAAIVSKRMKDNAALAKQSAKKLMDLVQRAMSVAQGLQHAGSKLQGVFGQAGDPAASNLMQQAKESAGKLQHIAEAAEKAAKSANADIKEASNFTQSPTGEEVVRIFDLNERLEKFGAMVEAEIKALSATVEKYDPTHSKATMSAKPSEQYYPILYFAGERKRQDVPTTCTGNVIGEPKFVNNGDACAAACDDQIHTCVGYSLVGQVCFLLSSFKEAQFYVNCTGEEKPKPTCMAKLSKFQGTSLKPEGTGRCKECLKKMVQADRCFAKPPPPPLPKLTADDVVEASKGCYGADADFEFSAPCSDDEPPSCAGDDLANFGDVVGGAGCAEDAARDIVIRYKNECKQAVNISLNTCHAGTALDTTIAAFGKNGPLGCADDTFHPGNAQAVDLPGWVDDCASYTRIIQPKEQICLVISGWSTETGYITASNAHLASKSNINGCQKLPRLSQAP